MYFCNIKYYNMKKILLLAICLYAMFSMAAPVSPTVARQVAENFYAVNAGKNIAVSLLDVSQQSDFQELYIFVHPIGKGFVIVSADDCAQPIVAYSLTNPFAFPLPEHVGEFLAAYDQEIAYYKENHIRASAEITSMWTQLMNGTYTPRNTTSVNPMLTTTWGQQPLYNDLCPDSAGVHAVAGCTATATAQVMKYWNWPVMGTGSYSYVDDNFGTQSANFGTTTYNWSLMPNALTTSSTAAEVNAVATLIYHVGVAVEMDYGISASGAYTNSYGYSDLPCSENALKDYFGYKSTLYSVYKSQETDASWIAVLTSELNAGRPIIESGHGGGGHAFVCDGYDNNGLFHINWGWRGSYDGYFAHNALNPGGGGTGAGSTHSYNDNQSLVVGIEPNGVLWVNPQQLNFNQEGGSLSFTVSSNSNSSASWTASSNQSWLTVSPASGAGSGSVTTVNATATVNNTGVARSAVITVTQGNQTVSVNVLQSECSTMDMCTLTFQMEDTYGDGWNSSYLTVSSASGYVYGTVTLSDGNSATQEMNVCPSNVQLTWTSGSQWDNECSFTVLNASGQSLLNISSPTANANFLVSTPCAGAQPNECNVTSFPWTESFENDIDCWSFIDADGDGNNWAKVTGAPYDGTYSMVSYSYDNTNQVAMNAMNYMISPRITLPATGNYQLSFYARSANNSYPDSMMVKMSTTSNTSTNSFNVTLKPLTMIPQTYQQYTVDLTGYNGQSFYLAFIHDSYDGYYLILDNISIVNTSENFTITATSSNTTMGDVTGGGSYSAGQVATLVATANVGYRFTGWSDNNTENPRNINVTANASYIASFADLGSNELHYDNGTFASLMGAGGNIYWAVRFPASVLSSYNTLSSVRLWDVYAGTYQISVCQGGSNAPGTQIATQSFTLNGSGTWFTATFSSPVSIDNTQPLWIVLNNTDVTYPASGSHYAGNPDGSWVSTDGSNWASICDYGYNLSWMLRPVLSGNTPPQSYTVTVTSANSSMGTVSGGGTYSSGEEASLSATANEGYRFISWNDGNTDNPRNFTVMSNVSYTASFADLGSNELHYDNGTYKTSMGAGGTLYWAMRLPASVLSSYNTLSSVRLWDQNAGTYQISVCQGGTDAPGTQIATQTFTLSGSGTWFTATFSNPVSIDNTQPLWIVLYNTDVTYPAAASSYAGNPDGSWISTDGSTWASICDYNYYLTWMVRPVLTNVVTNYTITAVSSNTGIGTVTGGGTYAPGETAVLMASAISGYRFTGWNDGNTENPRSVVVSGNATYTASFDNLGTNELHYDNGTYVNSLGAGGSVYWAVKLPANVLSSYHSLSSVRIWDQYAGSYEIRICQGGTSAPGTQIAAQTFSLNGSQNWYNAEFSTFISIDNTQPLWVVLYNTGVTYPIASSHYAGNSDGSWISTNGSAWAPVSENGYYYTWMVRPVLSTTMQSFTITATSSDPALGTVTGGGTYTYGSEATLTAEPADHCHFVNWSDGSTANPRTVTVTADASYVANFARYQYYIAVTTDDASMGTASGGGTYDYGSVITITATPNEGYEFLNWSDENTENPRTVTVTGNATYKAFFTPVSSISDVNMSQLEVYSFQNHIVVNQAEGMTVEIYDMLGKRIVLDADNAKANRVFTVNTTGIYMVKVGDTFFKKVIVR